MIAVPMASWRLLVLASGSTWAKIMPNREISTIFSIKDLSKKRSEELIAGKRVSVSCPHLSFRTTGTVSAAIEKPGLVGGRSRRSHHAMPSRNIA
jgi:hypothetical protein